MYRIGLECPADHVSLSFLQPLGSMHPLTSGQILFYLSIQVQISPPPKAGSYRHKRCMSCHHSSRRKLNRTLSIFKIDLLGAGLKPQTY